MMTAGRWMGWRQSQRECSVMTGQDVDGPGGSPSLRGRMAVRPVITEHSRGRLGAGGWLCGSVINEDIRAIQDRVPERGVEPLCPCGQTGLSRPRIPFRHPGLGAANRNTAWLECAP